MVRFMKAIWNLRKIENAYKYLKNVYQMLNYNTNYSLILLNS